MNSDKIGKWLEIAKHFSGSEFWNEIFDQPGAKQMMETHPYFQGSGGDKPALLPLVDLLQGDGELIVLVDLPGVAKEDVELSAGPGALYVKGEAKPLFPGAAFLSKERLNGPFTRTIPLPAEASSPASRITAAYHEGVLIVRITTPAPPKRSIPID
ncbi:Hsp20/alpha crystallin family protein [Paenibacillus filicis]|uniref:Hsp20/alpha crystallin family protein n=1 Tax=Paenibacillus gyeongsangnamensis TaxID=3388067 RepID=A0ABT4QAY9_9BACL|nr:Hsp20/alpha crystallin family protein [Paenibacillus filicis]MCZ8514050.1 Hsp20/alpha crystallin family protein [Paenibacillus filicis]